MPWPSRSLGSHSRSPGQSAALRHTTGSGQRFAQAERALALAETAYGPEHPYVGIALHNLAGILWERSVISLLPARWPNPKCTSAAVWSPMPV